MRLTQLASVSFAALGCASLASAQCPLQVLEADVGDFTHLGLDLSLSGSRLLVGSENEQTAVLFERGAGGWSEAARFRSPLGPGAEKFGQAVAIDGDTAVVSDPSAPTNGRAFVYVRSGTGWTLQATLAASDGIEEDLFGPTLAIDGETIAIRKKRAFDWAVHVFERTGGTWTEVSILKRNGINFYGTALALEGDTLLVGDPGDAFQGFNAGAAYFYERRPMGWQLEQRLLPAGNPDQEFFGNSVALDGTTAVVGSTAPFDSNRTGSASVYELVGGEWLLTQQLVGSDAPGTGTFGIAVALETDRLLVADAGSLSSDTPGAVYVFERVGSTFTQTSKLRRPAADGGYDRFGVDVALSGGEAFAGSPNEGQGVEQGAVHVFDLLANRPVPYCLNTPNSTGAAANIASIGSLQAEVDDVTLTASPVPNQAGLFLMAAQAAQRPLFDGFLCVSAPLIRLPMTMATGNTLTLEVELAGLPVQVAAGSTWNFQAWYFDPAGAGSGANFSDGLSVTFCP